ncbi:hypothetical protein ABZ570_33400 [Micromonospora sp. NPDC007271]|uniref:hypothetical protein n=1 Tax=Micromonospora sp. NPDC007271 TaxID=3154587 RepID=UPI0033C58E31
MRPTKDPWWQTAKTPKQGFIMGGFWLFLALGWVVAAIGQPKLWPWIFAALWAVGGVAYLVPAVLLRRRQRSAEDGPGREAGVLPD